MIPAQSLYQICNGMKFIRPFFFGILAALGALFLELIIGMLVGSPQDLKNIFSDQITPLLASAVLTEELLKFTFIYRRSWELKVYFQDSNSSVGLEKVVFLNSIFIGLGFSFIELAFIFFSLPSIKDALTLKLAISGILIIHTATSAIMGYLLARYESAKYVVIPTILIAAVFIHLFYNSLIIYSARPFFVFLYLLSVILIFAALALAVNLKNAKNTGS